MHSESRPSRYSASGPAHRAGSLPCRRLPRKSIIGALGPALRSNTRARESFAGALALIAVCRCDSWSPLAPPLRRDLVWRAGRHAPRLGPAMGDVACCSFRPIPGLLSATRPTLGCPLDSTTSPPIPMRFTPHCYRVIRSGWASLWRVVLRGPGRDCRISVTYPGLYVGRRVSTTTADPGRRAAGDRIGDGWQSTTTKSINVYDRNLSCRLSWDVKTTRDSSVFG